jgi:outer membrane protein assembly factor BamD (BamD/ComL family)
MIAGCVSVVHPSEPQGLAGPKGEMQRAASFEKEKKYSDAIAVYRKIVTDYPQSPVAADALFAIAHLHAFYDNPQKDYARALADFEDFDKRYPDHEKFQEAKNWETVLKLMLDTKKENSRLRKSIDQLEKVDIKHEERRER